LTGHKIKLSPAEKLEIIENEQKSRDQFEDSHLGGYRKVFPIDKKEVKLYY